MAATIQSKKEINMKLSKLLRWLFVVIVLSVPWIYLSVIWKSLPDTIPLHFGVDGTPDKYGSKNQLIYILSAVTAGSLLLYLLLVNISKIDPKRYANKQQDVFLKIAFAVIIFLSVTILFILNWTQKQHTSSLNLFLVLFGLLFAYIGNMLHSIKPNYFAGFRLPWTLESEANWKATHRFASKVWFAGGILIAILALFIKPVIMLFILFGLLFVMLIIPAVYSFRYFKKEKTGPIQ